MNEWISLVEKIRSIAQIGGSYTKDPYDKERYQELTAVSHKMFSLLSEEPVGKVVNFFIPEKGYATAKVDLRAGIFRGSEILLVRETRDGNWALPGGWADVGETPKEGIVREVYEETGYRVKVDRLVSIRDQSVGGYTPRYPVHVYKMFFLCTIIEGEASTSIETSEVKYFDALDLPELSIGTTLARDIMDLRDCFESSDCLVIVD